MLDLMMEFLRFCPLLEELEWGADLSDEDCDWCLYDRGFELEQLYWDGSRRLCQNFSLELKLPAADREERLRNDQRMEKLAAWLLDQNRAELPYLGEEREALSLSCSKGELGRMEADGILGSYQIQLQLRYAERSGSLAFESAS